MRLDRELGTLNREIVAIKDKWKIALNIYSKKIAIEKLITKRKRLRDSEAVLKMVENAVEVEKEEKIISSNSNKAKSYNQFEEIDESIFDAHNSVPLKPQIVEIIENLEKLNEPITKPEMPIHFTVNWLRDRMKN